MYIGSGMCLVGFLALSHLDNVLLAILGFGVIGGIGAGLVYATCINNAIKWFPDRRGLGVGLTAAGYGSGTILTVVPIANMIASSGYQAAFFTFGLIQGVVIVVFASFLRAPRPGVIKYSASVAQSRRDYTLGEALRTPVFWVMLAMFTGTVTGGLMAVAQLSVIAEDLGVRNIEINFYFFTMAALPFALTGALLALHRVGDWSWANVGWRLLWIIVAMVAARSAAMGFNRLVDARYDALNPRTASREIPRGVMSHTEAAVFVTLSSLVFMFAAWQLGTLTLLLSPIALIIVFWYSLAKRFTSYTQLFLGLAMAVAPVAS